ncbi:TetR/AcrR family transcriptional regulator [Nocardioides yefusunii]|uniref:TetR/AcrR family transcriptional regulator n=1 Tax=Nocardioides yefusunii TaxID=2500546 RepID=A0ABW1QWV7_9ACTN|nr:TetR/AcrR family transcriptional regulator [Nocardioides yefusunii]
MAAGLRERKKRRTVNAIEQAGVRLALEKGFKDVTVQEICDEADISRSTFFNYMPSREAAIFGRPLKMAPREEAWAVLEEVAPFSLLGAIMQISVLSIGGAEINQEVAAGRNRLRDEQPECLPLLLSPMTSYSLELVAIVAEWLAVDPSRSLLPGVGPVREATHIVNVAVGALNALLAEMREGDDDMLTFETLSGLVGEIRDVASALVAPALVNA